jgi:SanA protein
MSRVGDGARRVLAPVRRHPRIAWAVAAVLALPILLIAAANAYVILSTEGEATGDVQDVPRAEVAIVPGALVDPQGRMSTMLADRVSQAAALWHAGKVERVLVSGDHGAWAYDEPDTMRDALVKDGVPQRDIFTDHAGFDTWATMVRAKRVFDVGSAVIVTQGFHMPRALYLAHAAGLDATGLTADLHSYGKQGTLSDAREVLSRVKAVADVATDAGVILGPQVPITGSARASWGPAPPPGTPPAGAPSAAHPSQARG